MSLENDVTRLQEDKIFKGATPEELKGRRKDMPKFYIEDDFSWGDELKAIIADYKGDDTDPLDGDEVDILVENIRKKINYLEGNITREEYDT